MHKNALNYQNMNLYVVFHTLQIPATKCFFLAAHYSVPSNVALL